MNSTIIKKWIDKTGGIITVLFLGILLTSCNPMDLLRQSTGQLEIVTNPPGARVMVNNEDRGIAPLNVRDLAPGDYLIEVKMDGYRDARKSVRVYDGESSLANIALEPARGLLLVESVPEEADIYIDNAFRGKTPRMFHDLRLGTHRIRFQAEGYFPREVDVILEDRRPRHVLTEMVSDSAVVTVDSVPEGATVRINGSNVGRTPARIERVSTGEILLEVLAEGYTTYRREMRLRSGEEYRVEAELEPMPGGLEVTSTPTGARIFINDEFRGETPAVFNDLDAGMHDVRVERRGFTPQSRRVMVAAGRSRSEEFTLPSDSGRLIIVTEPARVQVYIDGELVGTTEAGETDVVSEPLVIDYVPSGQRRLNLVRRGYSYTPKNFTMEANDVLSLHEELDVMFIPDTIVRKGPRASDVYRGMLIRRHPSGDVDLMVRPGIITRIAADEIISIEPIRESSGGGDNGR